ncbi:hypothetical protein WUBG_08534 [Wuchereria bancrofti]|uniref:FGFR1 oncogene partner 2 homolog n=1 Tax=Wuchereria bancrofti TaxID=6293 RepID=J9ETX0_WUCBA|nr:hypothetical protein WUBG_08534 [Wuchereria bancrofti]VDM10874.1 unnamed protein product [Wuchereria bancrofti]
MSTTSIGQLMADMRQLVISLQTRERATDNALAKSQILSDKISGLQHENRQILQLQQENRELRQALEDCENTLQLIMQKHRDVVTKLAKQFIPSFRASVTHTSKKCETSINEKIVILSRLLNECLADGESVLNHDQELIARLATENACLRELLNISTHNEPNIARHFLDLANDGIPNYSDGSTTVYDKNCEQSDVSFTGDSLLHNKEAVRQNSVLVVFEK